MFISLLVFLALLCMTMGFQSPRTAGPLRMNKNKMTTGLKSSLLTNVVLAPAAMYFSMSVNEYITHRYYQHTDFNRNKVLQNFAKFILRKKSDDGIKISGGGHVEHHAETYDDMSLKNDDKWNKTPAKKALDIDIWRGTAFSWPVYFIMCAQMLPLTVPLFKLLGFSLLSTAKWLFPSVLLHTTLWNTLHPGMHGLPAVPISHGPPSELFAFLRGSPYMNWIEANHVGHHVAGGQYNYNVCCPLTDHLVGTHMKESEWATMVRPKPDRVLTEPAV